MIIGRAAFCGAGDKLKMLLSSNIGFKTKKIYIGSKGGSINLLLLLSNSGSQRVNNLVLRRLVPFLIEFPMY